MHHTRLSRLSRLLTAPRSAVLTLFLGSSILAAAGCGDDGAGDAVDAAVDAMTVCEPEIQDPLPPATGDISGTWGLFTKFQANVSFGGAQISRSYYLHEYVQNGDALTLTETLCTLEVDAANGGQTVRVAAAFVASQPPVARTGTVVPNGAVYEYALDTSYVVRGATLVDVINDDLPADAADPRVEDQDGDGNPGLTLVLDGLLRGQLFIAQRDFTTFAGTQVSEDRVEGLAQWGSDIVYLGANPEAILGVVEPALPDPDPNLHTFQVVRLPAGSSCEYILQNRCSLFSGVQ